MSAAMMHETIWFDRNKYDEAEHLYQAHLNGPSPKSVPTPAPAPIKPPASPPKTQGSCSSSAKEIAEARRKIQQTLSAAPSGSSTTSVSEKRVAQLEADNKELRKITEDLTEAIKKLELRVAKLESTKAVPASDPAAAPVTAPASAAVKKEEKKDDSDDEDEDLFGSSSEEEDEEYQKIKEQRLAAYEAKKAKKPQVVAKSSIILDVKPWDDETDLLQLEANVRSIATDGLLWGASKIVPVAYGIKKLQISCVVEDDKVGTDFLEEQISAFEDFVQSIDVVAFNKI